MLCIASKGKRDSIPVKLDADSKECGLYDSEVDWIQLIKF